MRIITFIVTLFCFLPNCFSQNFTSPVVFQNENELKEDVKIIKTYKHKSENKDTLSFNDKLDTENSLPVRIAYYDALGKKSKVIMYNDQGKDIVHFEYDNFANILRRVIIHLGKNGKEISSQDIVDYKYNYDEKTLAIFKNEQLSLERKFDAKNRLIQEEFFKPQSPREVYLKNNYEYLTDDSFKLSIYKKGELKGTRTVIFDSLTQIRSINYESANGKKKSAIHEKTKDGMMIEKIGFDANNTVTNRLRYFCYEDECGNAIKQYAYSSDRKYIGIIEYEIEYY